MKRFAIIFFIILISAIAFWPRENKAKQVDKTPAYKENQLYGVNPLAVKGYKNCIEGSKKAADEGKDSALQTIAIGLRNIKNALQMHDEADPPKKQKKYHELNRKYLEKIEANCTSIKEAIEAGKKEDIQAAVGDLTKASALRNSALAALPNNVADEYSQSDNQDSSSSSEDTDADPADTKEPSNDYKKPLPPPKKNEPKKVLTAYEYEEYATLVVGLAGTEGYKKCDSGGQQAENQEKSAALENIKQGLLSIYKAQNYHDGVKPPKAYEQYHQAYGAYLSEIVASCSDLNTATQKNDAEDIESARKALRAGAQYEMSALKLLPQDPGFF